MGQDDQQLAAVFQKIYRSDKALHATGQFKAEMGKGLLSRVVAFMIGIPVSAVDQPATLVIERKAKYEVWRRNFGGKKFASRFYDAGNFKVEQVAVVKFYFKMLFGESVHYHGAGIGISKLRAERFLKISSNNYSVSDHEWDFEVIIQNRKSELVFRYGGRMKIDAEI